MATTMTTAFALAVSLLAGTQSAPAQVMNEFAQSARANANEDREAAAYDEGTDALNEGKYDRALRKFDDVTRMKLRRAEGAMYWKAFTLNKLGRPAEALAAIAELRAAAPQSKWTKEAGALEIEIKGAAGRPVQPENQQDEDLKLLALNRLMDSDEERAIPLLQKFLAGNQSLKLKDRALFVLSQSGNPKAKELIGSIAKGAAHPTLQNKAIHYLGISGGQESMRILEEVYQSSTDVDAKRKVLHSFGISGEKARLLSLAKTETNPDLVKQATRSLGIAGGKAELRELYRTTNSFDVKINVLDAMVIAGDSEQFGEIASTETDPKLRKKAIHGVGISGGRNASDQLLAIYNAQPDKETRKQVIQALFISGSAKTLVELAKKETDSDLKRSIVEKLSLMDDKDATDYMIQILDR